MTTLEVTDLVKDFPLRGGGWRRSTVRAVDGVSFALLPGETVALVGESGSGKSTIARILSRLTRPTSGRIALDGVPIRYGRPAEVRRYRKDVQMVFQDPFASLNPTHTIRHHLVRPLRIHNITGRNDEAASLRDLLYRVNLVPPEMVVGRFPHELSGGQRQRVAIARALAPQPSVLIADEPVSMLDVSIRLEILNLLDRLKAEASLAMLYITHDLATARHFSSSIMVMYRGEIVESGSSDEVILSPAHPYTRLLAGAAPDPGAQAQEAEQAAEPASGPRTGGHSLSSATAADTGCRFRDRCPFAMDVCEQRPPAFQLGPGHWARCWLHDETDDTTRTTHTEEPATRTPADTGP